jgi:hypothetical protein
VHLVSHEGESQPPVYYLDAELEIMSTSKRHELFKKLIAGLLEIFFDYAGIEIVPHGQATMQQELKAAGAEPDESWSIGQEKQYADLVLEIALSSGGIPRLAIYQRFAIPAVWFVAAGPSRIIHFGSLRPIRAQHAKQAAAGIGYIVARTLCGDPELARGSPRFSRRTFAVVGRASGISLISLGQLIRIFLGDLFLPETLRLVMIFQDLLSFRAVIELHSIHPLAHPIQKKLG